jgi:hypothetical protein
MSKTSLVSSEAVTRTQNLLEMSEACVTFPQIAVLNVRRVFRIGRSIVPRYRRAGEAMPPDYTNATCPARRGAALRHNPEKWKPAFRKDHASSNYLERDRFSLKRSSFRRRRSNPRRAPPGLFGLADQAGWRFARVRPCLRTGRDRTRTLRRARESFLQREMAVAVQA